MERLTIEHRNDLNNPRKIYDLLEVIKTKHTFQTENGIKSKQKLDEVIEQFLKPYLIQTGKELS